MELVTAEDHPAGLREAERSGEGRMPPSLWLQSSTQVGWKEVSVVGQSVNPSAENSLFQPIKATAQ